MADEEIQDQMSESSEEIGTQESQQETIEQQQAETTPEWQKSFQTPDQMYEFARQKQSEADRYKQQLSEFQKQQTQSGNAQEVEQDVLDEFVKDPKGFFTKMMAPVQVQLYRAELARKHPDADQLWDDMVSYVNQAPGILAHPEGMEMVYNHLKTQRDASKANYAAQVKQNQVQQTNQLKKQGAVVEGSTVSQKEASPAIKPGMSVEEMDKALDQAGIGWITDEERHKFDE